MSNKHKKAAAIVKFGTGQAEKKLGLYLHIPFCLSKCRYCDFYSIKNEKSVITDYIAALARQMEYYSAAARGMSVDTIYFGGGTPSLLSVGDVKRIMAAIRANLTVEKNAEISFEVNPATGDKNYFKKLARLGINRFSVGLQSANDDELAAIGRVHSLADFEQTLEYIKRSGVENIGVDLMYGLPNQTAEKFDKSLDYAISLPITHLSVYGLTLETGTPLYNERESLTFPSEEEERQMYFTAVSRLADGGFAQDEISNFSKPGFHSRHNLKYWNCDEYLGLGAAASSYFCGRRFTFARSVAKYIKAMAGEDVSGLLTENYELEKGSSLGDYVMLRLRLTSGVVFRDFTARYSKNFLDIFGKKLARYTENGLAVQDERHFALTPKGFYLSNYIISDILDI